MMDEEEIESWYEEQKNQAMDKFISEIQDTKEHTEAQQNYQKKLKEIMEQYKEFLEKSLEKKQRNKNKLNIKEKVSNIKDKMLNLIKLRR